jgi:hypothetical protein
VAQSSGEISGGLKLRLHWLYKRELKGYILITGWLSGKVKIYVVQWQGGGEP